MDANSEPTAAPLPWLLLALPGALAFVLLFAALLLGRLVRPLNAHGLGGLLVGAAVLAELASAIVSARYLLPALRAVLRHEHHRSLRNVSSITIAVATLGLLAYQVASNRALPVGAGQLCVQADCRGRATINPTAVSRQRLNTALGGNGDGFANRVVCCSRC